MHPARLIAALIALSFCTAPAIRCVPAVTLVQAGAPARLPGPFGPLPVVVRAGQVLVPLIWATSYDGPTMVDNTFNIIRFGDRIFRLGAKEYHDLAPKSWAGVTATFLHPLRAAPMIVNSRIYLPLEGLSEFQAAAVSFPDGTLKLVPKQFACPGS